MIYYRTFIIKRKSSLTGCEVAANKLLWVLNSGLIIIFELDQRGMSGATTMTGCS